MCLPILFRLELIVCNRRKMMKDIEKQLTISSIKVQKFRKILPLREAFIKGTIYVDLYKPFMPKKRGVHYER